MKISIDTSSLAKELKKDIKKIEKGIQEGINQVATEIVDMQHNIIDTNVGGDGSYVRTGQLHSGVTMLPLEKSDGVSSVTITNTTSYSSYNEKGTGIYADDGNGRQDGWYYPVGDGTYRFTMGLPPKHFVKDSYEFYKDKAPTIISNSIKL